MISLRKLATLVACLAPAAVSAASVTFGNSRGFLFDVNGEQIDAYGAPLQSFNGTYYLYGNSLQVNGTFYGIRGYSSIDLVNWAPLGDILSPDLTAYCYAASGFCGRPHMLYHPKLDKYILWLNGGTPGYLVSTSDSPAGPFVANADRASTGSEFASLQAADFSVESDGDDAYIVFSALNFESPDSGSIWPAVTQTIHVSKLTDDWQNLTGTSYPVRSAAFDLVDQETESPDIFWRNGTVYVIASNTCGSCNGTLGLVYRSDTIDGNWTRQIISGYSCNGQVEGVALLTDPSTNETSYVWHSTKVPGGTRVAWTGHIFQPLQFNEDGSVNDLDCSTSASFPVSFAPGTSEAPSGNATTAVDGSPSDAVYHPTCLVDKFSFYQTWQASKAGYLSSVSVNVARGAQVLPLSIEVFTNFSSFDELTAPGFRWESLGTGTFYPENMTYAFGTVTVPIDPPVAVTEGQYLGFSFANGYNLLSLVYNFSPFCHLEYDNDGSDGMRLYQQGSGQESLRGADGMTRPVYQRVGKGIKFFANYAA